MSFQSSALRNLNIVVLALMLIPEEKGYPRIGGYARSEDNNGMYNYNEVYEMCKYYGPETKPCNDPTGNYYCDVMHASVLNIRPEISGVRILRKETLSRGEIEIPTF